MNGSFSQRIVVTASALTALFAFMAPGASEPLGFMSRLMFWALHIGLGLVTAIVAAGLVLRVAPSVHDWRLVALSGLGGVLLFAPIAFGLEFLFPLAASEPDTDWADRLAQRSGLAAILVEAIEMGPSYLAAWALINLQPLGEALRGERTHAAPEHRQPPAAQTVVNPFLDRLPPAVGREVVAVTSDLHYLKVTTRTGQAMILGALKEVEEAFGDRGLRVHRSHWVHRDAVIRLRKAGSGWHLELEGGHRVPVSRRKRSEVITHLGDDFVRESSAA